MLSYDDNNNDDDDDDDVFIELPGLPSRGMLCGYENGSSAAVASLSGIIYLMYNWLCSEVTSGSFAPVSPKLKNESATRPIIIMMMIGLFITN